MGEVLTTDKFAKSTTKRRAQRIAEYVEDSSMNAELRYYNNTCQSLLCAIKGSQSNGELPDEELAEFSITVALQFLEVFFEIKNPLKAVEGAGSEMLINMSNRLSLISDALFTATTKLEEE